MYYILVTACSIGYGDIYPVTTQSRMAIVLIIVFIISMFGFYLSNLANIIREHDFNDTTYKFNGHIIIMGTLHHKPLTRFLVHFYKHEQIKDNCPKCIIVGEKRISKKLKNLINYGLFE
jgi:hypothetical protein